MKARKFTIFYRDKRTDKTYCEHGMGSSWPVAAMNLLQDRAISAKEKDSTLDLVEFRDNFEILFAIAGHHKQLI